MLAFAIEKGEGGTAEGVLKKPFRRKKCLRSKKKERSTWDKKKH